MTVCRQILKVFNGAFVALLMCICTTSAYSAVREYQSQLHDTLWEIDASPLECRLSQDVPNYGGAVFVSRASRQMSMAFELSGRNRPQNITRVNVRSLAPDWMPGVASKDLGELRVTARQPIIIMEDRAWQLIAELEKGMFPTFYHTDWLSEANEVVVSLSAVNFNEYYSEFLRCVDKLLPYSFKDIEMTSVFFDYEKYDFTHETRLKLEKIAKFIDAMDVNDVNRLMIDLQGYTDSKGGTNYNIKLSKKRVMAVKDYLAMTGLSDNQFTTAFHGEKKPFAENKKPTGRFKNRRVIIRLSMIPG